MFEVFSKPFKQRLAALQAVAPRGVEVAGVPGIGDLGAGCAIGEVEEETNLLLGVGGDDAGDVAQIVAVHADDEVEGVVVVARHLTGGAARTRHALGRQLAASGRIDVVADFLAGGGGALDVEVSVAACFVDKVFHDVFRHRRSADVAVTDKEYASHHY